MAIVYVLDADHGTKVGMSSGDGTMRLAQLRTAGVTFTVVGLFEFDSAREAREVERLTHRILRRDRQTGEWFWCHPFDATAAVARAWHAYKYIAAQRSHDEDDPLSVVQPDKRPLRISPPSSASDGRYRAERPLKA